MYPKHLHKRKDGTFDIFILNRLAGLDVKQFSLFLLRPVPQAFGDKFQIIIHSVFLRGVSSYYGHKVTLGYITLFNH
jgi:hypothetical protein